MVRLWAGSGVVVAAEPIDEEADFGGRQQALLRILGIRGEGRHPIVVATIKSFMRRIAQERSQPRPRAVVGQIGSRAEVDLRVMESMAFGAAVLVLNQEPASLNCGLVFLVARGLGWQLR